MTSRKALLLMTAVLVLSVPVVPALAHDDEDNDYNSHDQLHDRLSDAHERAHEYGFYSRGEHRAYHRALRDLHSQYHYDNYDDAGPRYYYYSRPRHWGYRGWGY